MQTKRKRKGEKMMNTDKKTTGGTEKERKLKQSSVLSWEEENFPRSQTPPKPIKIKRKINGDSAQKKDEPTKEWLRQKDEWLDKIFQGRKCCQTKKKTEDKKKKTDYLLYLLIFYTVFALASCMYILIDILSN